MCSSLLQLAVGSRDLSQAENEIIFCKAEQIHKMATYFTQNDNFLCPKAMNLSPLLGPFCGSEFWGFCLLKI